MIYNGFLWFNRLKFPIEPVLQALSAVFKGRLKWIIPNFRTCSDLSKSVRPPLKTVSP